MSSDENQYHRCSIFSTIRNFCKPKPPGDCDGKMEEGNINVNEEYMEAFRTKSYIEMSMKVQSQLMKKFSSYQLQETLIPEENKKLHHLIFSYFQSCLDASKICQKLLKSVHRCRANHRIIQRRINTEVADLRSFANLKNPFADFSSFPEIRESQKSLFRGLNVKCRRMRRREKVMKIYKKVGLQSAQVDVAAKGLYILMNDLDTVSRLARRARDQVEHEKAMARICVRNDMAEILKEVVRVLGAQEQNFVEQLDELEEHIYLCLLNINRSRKLVLQHSSK